jgi:hypothetical protein
MLHPFSYIIVQIGCLAIGLFLSHPGTLILSSWPVIRNEGIQPHCAEMAVFRLLFLLPKSSFGMGKKYKRITDIIMMTAMRCFVVCKIVARWVYKTNTLVSFFHPVKYNGRFQCPKV